MANKNNAPLKVINYSGKEQGKYNAVNNNEAPINEDSDTDISKQELDLLDNAGSGLEQDNISINNALPDNSDGDGEQLNEVNDYTGDDLDVPGADADDADELKGEEDEENNSYSKSDQED